jgi:Mg2+-importing ATPase
MKKTVSFEQQFWHLTKEEALSSLSTSLNGLTSKDAQERLQRYGKNTLKDSTEISGLLLFLRQFKSPITLLLIIAALLSAFLGDVPDTLIIFVIVLISSFLSYWQEKGAAAAVKELLKMVQLRCTILRDSQKQELPFEMVVPGDIVYVSAGDIIPGDALLLDSQELFVDEAAFTGETFPVEKKCGVLPKDAPLSKRSNSLFMGAHIISGKASILIVQTGTHTEFGKIYTQLQLSAPETDFERGIRHFGYLLMEITLVLVLVIFAANVFLHKPILDSFLFSLALAVGLTPQLLPVIVSVNLAKGAKGMAERKVIVKRLSSIENLGSMTVLCSDKTGTITEGKVNLKDTLGVDGLHSDKTLEYAWINASKQQGFRNPIDEAICLAYKGDDRFRLQTEVPYDFIRKRLTVEVKSGDLHIVISKGALNNILSICSQVELSDGKLDDLKKHADSIRALYQQLSSSGFRTLGIAYKPWNGGTSFTRADEQGMVFMGFITLFDPPKADMAETIKQLSELGIGLKIITGDNELVARSLAISVGFKKPIILTGMMIQKMSNAALRHKAPKTDIFADVEPNQKDRIISMLKRAGHVVGFMGDGVNDAPALHTADVGISVDTAVDVAKQAADIVLLDRNLNVLAKGILEGRKTFTNTMKYIFMATSANFGNMFSMAGASLFLPFLPLLPKQILLTNLLTDFPEMAIATDRVDQINLQTPQRWDFSFIKRFMITFGLLSSVFDYMTFAVLILMLNTDEKQFQTGWFTESVLSATLIVLVVRTRLPFFKSLPGKYLFLTTLLILLFVLFIPLTPMAEWFDFLKLPLSLYGWILMIVVIYMFSAELMKSWFYKKVFKLK